MFNVLTEQCNFAAMHTVLCFAQTMSQIYIQHMKTENCEKASIAEMLFQFRKKNKCSILITYYFWQILEHTKVLKNLHI